MIRCEVFIYTWSGLRFPAQIQPNANWFSSGLLRDPHLGCLCSVPKLCWELCLIPLQSCDYTWKLKARCWTSSSATSM